MTTAARPTFDPARGQSSRTISFQYSSRDLASHTKLKFRTESQLFDTSTDLKQQLIQAEKEHFEKLRKEQGQLETEKERQKILLEAKRLDQDDEISDNEEEEDSSSESEDDTAELLRELEKIKQERAEEKAKQEQETTAESEKQRTEQMLQGNPLLSLNSQDFQVKRRWDEDVIFKNQASGLDDQPKKRFINDLLRSDFHRKFMNKYVR